MAINLPVLGVNHRLQHDQPMTLRCMVIYQWLCSVSVFMRLSSRFWPSVSFAVNHLNQTQTITQIFASALNRYASFVFNQSAKLEYSEIAKTADRLQIKYDSPQ
jgi:hypothetical protein